MEYKVKMYVSYKDGILDPVGKTTADALSALGYANVGEMAVGKYITFTIDAADADKAGTQIKEMADKLLTNPVIEKYHFELGQ
ncbi:phosphoribosylformylglycinamidine synthase subunit PurS [Candidatus Termititenax persephonae]|uniref:Phosphoribosylformylglycinamidine synthase subunit PurS n=1 Tax=Candidatus Termititenax persephonae TaxID=2218525 RepID=A0A388THD2_9BACT|nr:phosphoribosylformylglycinamidine synthase subunit PurS [Candidatus Termititenax persephonae]